MIALIWWLSVSSVSSVNCLYSLVDFFRHIGRVASWHFKMLSRLYLKFRKSLKSGIKFSIWQ